MRHKVYRTLNRPLTIWGVERRLFFVAAATGVGTFNLLSSLLGGLLMFITLYLAVRWITARDPQLLRILVNSSRFRVRYDPARRGGREN